MTRRVVTSADVILGEIADLLIEIRDRLPEKPPPAANGTVLLQEPATTPEAPPKRRPGRPRKHPEA